MSKPINEANITEWPFEDDLMFGRNWIRQEFTSMGVSQGDYYHAWYNLLKTIAMSTIKWNDVPAGIDTRAMEYILLHFGCGAIFAESGGLMFGQASFADMVNMYYNPNRVIITSPAGQWWYRNAQFWANDQGVVQEPNCVVCWDSMTRRPLLWTLKMYAKRLAQYDAVMDSNIDAQLTPWVIAAPADAKKQTDKMKAKLKRREQYWEVTQPGADMAPYVMQTGAPFVADNIAKAKTILLNEALTYCGVDNSMIDKKERVQTAEVLSNNELIMAMRRSRLKMREEFCRASNFRFGTQMSVEWGIEGSLADIVAALSGTGLNSLQMQQLMMTQGEGE